jgi:transcriptional regulator with XRE-family HTH domain
MKRRTSNPHEQAGRWLSQQVNARGSSKAAFAHSVGISRKHLIDLTKGLVRFHEDLGLRLANALGLQEPEFSCWMQYVKASADASRPPGEPPSEQPLRDLGQFIASARKARGLSAVELATILNIAPSNLSAYENGRRRMGLATAHSIGSALELSNQELGLLFARLSATHRAASPLSRLTSSPQFAHIMEAQLSSWGWELSPDDQVVSLLTPEVLSEFKRALPQIQAQFQEGMRRLEALARERAASQDTSPLSGTVRHADGRYTFVFFSVFTT